MTRRPTKLKPLQFQAELLERGEGGAWGYVRFPFNAGEIFGRKGAVPVRGTINGFAFRTSLMPRAGEHILGVNKEVQRGAGASTGDVVTVVLELDDAPREVSVPADLTAALAKAPAQAKVFAGLSYSHKKEYAEWIESAKKPQTRANRIEKAIAMIAAKKTPKG